MGFVGYYGYGSRRGEMIRKEMRDLLLFDRFESGLKLVGARELGKKIRRRSGGRKRESGCRSV